MSFLVTPVAGGAWVSTYLIPVLLEIKGAVVETPPFGERGLIGLGPWGSILVDAFGGSVVGHEKYSTGIFAPRLSLKLSTSAGDSQVLTFTPVI